MCQVSGFRLDGLGIEPTPRNAGISLIEVLDPMEDHIMGFTPVTPPVRVRKDRKYAIDADTAQAMVNAAQSGWVASDERFPNMKAAIAYGQKIRRDVNVHLDLDAAGLKLRTRTWEGDDAKFVIAFRAVPKDSDVSDVDDDGTDTDTDTESEPVAETAPEPASEPRPARNRRAA
jgi:hypothetical protein